MNIKRLKQDATNHAFVGTWHIYEMEMWNEDYFNMETQAYIEVESNDSGEFQFGLVSGYLNGYLEQVESQERFAFTWEGQDEMDEVNGSGWLRLAEKDTIEGLINFHSGDRSLFKARKVS